MRKSLFLTILILLFLSVYQKSFADNNKENWFTGEVMLTSGDVIKGKLKYNPEYNIIQLRTEDQHFSFSVKKVNHFKYYDDVNHYLRKYYAVNRETKRGFDRVIFLELLIDGEISLFRDHQEMPIKEKKLELSYRIDMIKAVLMYN